MLIIIIRKKNSVLCVRVYKRVLGIWKKWQLTMHDNVIKYFKKIINKFIIYLSTLQFNINKNIDIN